jgi:hypothetical protein
MYNKEQLVEAMTKYYQEFLDNPQDYEEDLSKLIPEVDAVRVVDILVNYMESK